MKFIKTTIIGGLVFMVPVVIVVAIFGKALELMMLVAKPLGKVIPVDSIGGVAVANVLALLGLALFCFVAGLIARIELAGKTYRSLDAGLLAIPGYAFIRGFTGSMSSSEEAATGLLPVLVRFDDNEQIGFEVERTAQGNVVVYLPGAPDPLVRFGCLCRCGTGEKTRYERGTGYKQYQASRARLQSLLGAGLSALS